jgi:hypothetical protein
MPGNTGRQRSGVGNAGKGDRICNETGVFCAKTGAPASRQTAKAAVRKEIIPEFRQNSRAAHAGANIVV